MSLYKYAKFIDIDDSYIKDNKREEEEDCIDYVLYTNEPGSSALSSVIIMLPKIVNSKIRAYIQDDLGSYINNNYLKYNKNTALLYYRLIIDYLKYKYDAHICKSSFNFIFNIPPNKLKPYIRNSCDIRSYIKTWAIILCSYSNKLEYEKVEKYLLYYVLRHYIHIIKDKSQTLLTNNNIGILMNISLYYILREDNYITDIARDSVIEIYNKLNKKISKNNIKKKQINTFLKSL